MKDDQVYAAIFDQVVHTLEGSGQTLPCAKETFLHATEDDPNSVDILELSRQKDNAKFLEEAYSRILKRTIDESALQAWNSSLVLPPEEFQALVVHTIVSSEEFSAAHVRLYNNIYPLQRAFTGAPPAGSPVTMPEKLMRIYRKMPAPMKKAARKMMGVK